MTQVAYKLNQNPELQVIEGGKAASERIEWSPTREMVMLSTLLIILQISDGILTGLGMGLFGTAAEGNAILRSLMEVMGYVPALILTKTFAILVICGLCYLSSVVSWLPKAMKAMIAVYLLAAVIPWTYILLTYPGA